MLMYLQVLQMGKELVYIAILAHVPFEQNFKPKFVQNSFNLLWIAMDLTVGCPTMILVLALTML